jgi:hypothetical protein
MAEPLVRPAALCAALLAALDASEGRSRRRKRDQTPDRFGLALERDLLTDCCADDPEPAAFEGWLLERCLAAEGGASVGAVRAVALGVLQEWHLARASRSFAAWLEEGAPSDDAGGVSGRPEPDGPAGTVTGLTRADDEDRFEASQRPHIVSVPDVGTPRASRLHISR